MNAVPVLFHAPLIRNLLEDGPYGATSSFQRNFFFGGGIGMWFIFLLLAIAGAIWISYEIQHRKLNLPGWKIASFVAIGLLLPAILFKFTVTEREVSDYYVVKEQIAKLERYQEGTWIDQVDVLEDQLANEFPPLTGMIETIIFLGIIGGLGGAGLAVAFYISYQGQTGPSQVDSRGYAPPPPPPPSKSRPISRPRGPAPRPSKPKANAWLVSREGKSIQLFAGETTIGRSSRNDIQIIDDTTISKGHAKIVETNGHFKLNDLGSTNGTKVNQRRVRQAVLLDPDDQIQFGDNTFFKFIKS